MPRRPRLFVSRPTYHIYCRVARGERVFDEPLEAEGFVEHFERFTGHEIEDRAFRVPNRHPNQQISAAAQRNV